MVTLGASMISHSSLKLIHDYSRKASTLGEPTITLGGDRIKINITVYNSTPEIYKALSSTSYAGKTMKNLLVMKKNKDHLSYTCAEDKSSKKSFSRFA